MSTLLEAHFWSVGSCRAPAAIVERGSPWHRQSFPALAVGLRHPAHGWTLYDTGYDPRYFTLLRNWTHRPMQWALPAELPPEEYLAHQMAEVGLDADDFRRVIVSHFHLDHIAGLYRFPRANLVFAEEAWQSVSRLSGWSAARAAFHPGAVEPAQIASQGHSLRTADAKPWRGFSCTWDLFDDDSLRLVALPGHACGQLGAVFRRAPDGREVFLVADAAWTQGNLQGRPPGWFARFLLHDPAVFAETLRQLSAFTTQHPDTLLVPSHGRETIVRLQRDAYTAALSSRA